MHDPHHVYLDLDVINNNHTLTGPLPILRFEEIKNTPFLDGDSSEYFCSIVRITSQTGNTIPVFIPSVVIGQNNPTLTIYAVSLTFTYRNIVYTSTQNVIYQPEDATAPIPDPPLLSQYFSSKYYNVYNYTHFVRLINTAFQTAFTDLCTKVPVGDTSPLFATVAPFIDFDAQTN